MKTGGPVQGEEIRALLKDRRVLAVLRRQDLPLLEAVAGLLLGYFAWE